MEGERPRPPRRPHGGGEPPRSSGNCGVCVEDGRPRPPRQHHGGGEPLHSSGNCDVCVEGGRPRPPRQPHSGGEPLRSSGNCDVCVEGGRPRPPRQPPGSGQPRPPGEPFGVSHAPPSASRAPETPPRMWGLRALRLKSSIWGSLMKLYTFRRRRICSRSDFS
jgi:hypothetical protein